MGNDRLERNYWLGRQRDSFMLAEAATDAEDRLIHYHAAGSHGVKALGRTKKPAFTISASSTSNSGAPMPRSGAPRDNDEVRYRELAQGAVYLASRATSAAQAAEHHRMAARYGRLARAAFRTRGSTS
jgi:hypothetical protein